MRWVAGVSQNCAFDSIISTDRLSRIRGRGRDARAPLFRHRHKRRLTVVPLAGAALNSQQLGHERAFHPSSIGGPKWSASILRFCFGIDHRQGVKPDGPASASPTSASVSTCGGRSPVRRPLLGDELAFFGRWRAGERKCARLIEPQPALAAHGGDVDEYELALGRAPSFGVALPATADLHQNDCAHAVWM
jgi:hypothetical protein